MTRALRSVSSRAFEEWNPCLSHPFSAIVRTWIRDTGDDPSRFEEEEESSVSWAIGVDAGISLVVSVYVDGTGRAYFVMECAIARAEGERKGLVAIELLELNRNVYEAYRVGMMDNGSIVCLARGRAEGYTPEYFRRLLDDLLGFSRKVQSDLKEKHGLPEFRPLTPDDNGSA